MRITRENDQNYWEVWQKLLERTVKVTRKLVKTTRKLVEIKRKLINTFKGKKIKVKITNRNDRRYWKI